MLDVLMKNLTLLTCSTQDDVVRTILTFLTQKHLALTAKHVSGASLAPKVIFTKVTAIHQLIPRELFTNLTVELPKLFTLFVLGVFKLLQRNKTHPLSCSLSQMGFKLGLCLTGVSGGVRLRSPAGRL